VELSSSWLRLERRGELGEADFLAGGLTSSLGGSQACAPPPPTAPCSTGARAAGERRR